jgi:TatD DNase family protein
MKYFDIHSHLQFDDFDTDRELVVKRAQDAEVGIINVGTNIETSKQAIILAEENKNMYAIVGLHPTYDEVFNYEEMKKLAIHSKVVAIGECGIDLFHDTGISLERQKEVFEKHLMIAGEVGKPVMLHVRSNAEQSAYAVVIEILKKYPEVKGNVHFFAGNVDEAKAFNELGYTLSFTGAITYPKTDNYREVIAWVPLDMIMAETDCPYVAPVPYRGKRNEPVYVLEVIKKISEIKQLPFDQVSSQLRENVRRVFGI